MIKKLAPYTKGYRLLMLFAIACSAGEAVLELTLPKQAARVPQARRIEIAGE